MMDKAIHLLGYIDFERNLMDVAILIQSLSIAPNNNSLTRFTLVFYVSR